MASCIFPFGIEDDLVDKRGVDRACMSAMWFYALGYVTTISAFISKIFKVNRVFRSLRNMERIVIESFDIWVPYSFLLVVNVTILLVWNLTDRVMWFRDPVNPPDRESSIVLEEVSTFGYCDSTNYRIYLGLILGINYVVSLFALVQAYECRKIDTDYAEVLWVSASMAAVVQIWTIGLPLLKILDDDPLAIFFVKVGVVFLTTMSTLILTFVPKVRYLRQEWREPPSKIDLGIQSITSQEYDASFRSDESPNRHRNARPVGKGGQEVNPAQRRLHRPKTLPPEGVRIIQTSARHSEAVEKLEHNLRKAEERNKELNERLERIQEKMEQYAMAHHPFANGDNHEPSMREQSPHNILSARVQGLQLHREHHGVERNSTMDSNSYDR